MRRLIGYSRDAGTTEGGEEVGVTPVAEARRDRQRWGSPRTPARTATALRGEARARGRACSLPFDVALEGVGDGGSRELRPPLRPPSCRNATAPMTVRKTTPPSGVLEPTTEGAALAAGVQAGADDEQRIEAIVAFLRRRGAEPDQNAELAARIVDAVAADRQVASVADLARRFEVSPARCSGSSRSTSASIPNGSFSAIDFTKRSSGSPPHPAGRRRWRTNLATATSPISARSSKASWGWRQECMRSGGGRAVEGMSEACRESSAARPFPA